MLSIKFNFWDIFVKLILFVAPSASNLINIVVEKYYLPHISFVYWSIHRLKLHAKMFRLSKSNEDTCKNSHKSNEISRINCHSRFNSKIIQLFIHKSMTLCQSLFESKLLLFFLCLEKLFNLQFLIAGLKY